MSGYIRQSATDIVPTAVVRSAPVNAEFNALRDAFAFTTGHKHDGNSSEGAYIPLIADVDGNNKVVVDTANNRVAFYSEVSSAPAAQFFVQDGAILPATANDVDLGSGLFGFKNIWAGGTATINNLIATTSTLASVDINGGTVDGTAVGSTVASTVRGTVVTATNKFVGNIEGNVTGNVTGNITGNVTGVVTGSLQGNVTATSGVTTLNNLTVNGLADFTNTTLENIATPTVPSQAANKSYVDQSISNLIGGAPGTLDTLAEIAASLNSDANVFNTLNTSINTKLSKAGDTMSGILAMGSNRITGVASPSVGSDAVNLTYVTTLFGSTTAAAGSAVLADKYANEAENVEVTTGKYSSKHYSLKAAASAAGALSSEGIAVDAKDQTLAALDQFTDTYLGAFASAPTLDNDGNALQDGALYKDSTSDRLYFYDLGSTSWKGTTPSSLEQASIDTVATNIADVNTVAGDISSVNTVSGSIGSVNTVGTNISTVVDAATTLTSIQTAMLQMATAFTNSQTRYVAAVAFA